MSEQQTFRLVVSYDGFKLEAVSGIHFETITFATKSLNLRV